MEVTCDKCKEIFDISMDSKKLAEDLYQEYFECPKCSEIYIVNVLNDKCKELRFEVQELQKEYDNRQTVALFNEIKQKQKEFKKEMLKINKKVD